MPGNNNSESITFVASLPQEFKGIVRSDKAKASKMVKCFGVHVHNNKANYDILRLKRIQLKLSCM